MVKLSRWVHMLRSALPMGGNGGGRWGGRSLFYGLLPGARVDYRKLAGDPWKNSIVAASINWIGRNLPQAPPCVYTIASNGKRQIAPKHALTKLLNRPNKFYSGRVLRTATILSLIVDGNAYWYIIRDNLGRPKELWYLPHFLVRPTWPTGATTDNWIDGYWYQVPGQQPIPLTFEDVIHFRDGLDPDNPRLGLSPLASAWRELVTDNEASGYSAALLRNMGIPGAIITPNDPQRAFKQPQKDELKAEYEDATTGDNRGRPIVLSGPVDVKQLGLSPEQMLLTSIQDKPEERICALIGIPAGVLGLGVGLEKSTYNNREADHEAAWYDCIIPQLGIIHAECDVQLLPLLGNEETEEVGADYSQVRALTESTNDLYERLESAVGGPFLTPNEARAELGIEPIEGGDVLYPPKAITPPPPAPEKPKEDPDAAKGVIDRFRAQVAERRRAAEEYRRAA